MADLNCWLECPVEGCLTKGGEFEEGRKPRRFFVWQEGNRECFSSKKTNSGIKVGELNRWRWGLLLFMSIFSVYVGLAFGAVHGGLASNHLHHLQIPARRLRAAPLKTDFCNPPQLRYFGVLIASIEGAKGPYKATALKSTWKGSKYSATRPIFLLVLELVLKIRVAVRDAI